MTPTVFIQFLSKLLATPEVMVFFHLRPLSTPSVPVADRYTVIHTIIPNCYRLIIRHGYMDEVITENLGLLVYEQVRNFIIRGGGALPEATRDGNESSKASSEQEVTDPMAVRLAEIQKAYERQVLYIVGKEQMRISKKTRIWRRVVLNAFLWLRENTRSKIASMQIPTDQLVEVGFIKEI